MLVTQERRATPDDVDAAWLTDAFERCGVARGATVTDVRFEGYIGTGQTGSNGRFTLSWDQPDRPASVVAKFPSRDAAAAEAAFAGGTYRKEWNFYVNVAPTVSVRAPRCYAACYDEATHGFVLLLEDLAGSDQGDQLDGLHVDQVATALRQAVALHAPRWGDPSLDLLAGEPTLTIAEQQARLQEYYGLTLEPCLARLGHDLDADVIDLARRFAPLVGAWAGGTGTPRTIVHHDFRADNLLFARTAAAPDVVVVDWQTVNPGLAVSDVAYLVSGSFPDPQQRRAVEVDLVEEYRRQLVAAGVDYDAATCWRDYRVGSLWGLIITVIATVVAAQTERGDAMLTAMFSRHGRQALDLDALALLEGR